jgi:WD40 repeat protein
MPTTPRKSTPGKRVKSRRPQQNEIIGVRQRHRFSRAGYGKVALSHSGDALAIPTWTGKIHVVAAGGTTNFGDARHKNIGELAWSSDDQLLAACYSTNQIRIWGREGELRRSIETPSPANHTIRWSPAGLIATAGSDDSVHIIDWLAPLRREVSGLERRVRGICWLNKDSDALIGYDMHGNVMRWDARSGEPIWRMRTQSVPRHELRGGCCVAPNDKFIALGAGPAVQIVEPSKGSVVQILEGLGSEIADLEFTPDGRLLIGIEGNGTLHFWDTGSWAHRYKWQRKQNPQRAGFASIALRYNDGTLFATSTAREAIDELDVQFARIVGASDTAVHYTNAKVVLVGDTGVGKSGLGLVLSGEPFAATESTHGRRVWTLAEQSFALSDVGKETREVLLWDLAGQPGYRLIHQLHLGAASVAVLVFDARSETDPFGGVVYWTRALRQAWLASGADSNYQPRKILVAARTDRGGVGVSSERIDAMRGKLEISEYIETSAKTGAGISRTRAAILNAIQWDNIPRVSSSELLIAIKSFILAEKKAGRFLLSTDELFDRFTAATSSAGENGREEFDVGLDRVEATGLIRRLTFGDLVLLQPEFLDAYASAIVNAAKDEPDGLGSIAEEDVLAGRFPLNDEERLGDKEQEKLLLIATIENLLRHEIALREEADDGPHLIFPSQFTREWPEAPDPEGKSVVYRFEGPVLNIYSTLVVRIAHSGVFVRREMWKNAVLLDSIAGGSCGLWLRHIEEGRAELTLFFQKASDVSRARFDSYVAHHLLKRAVPDSVHRTQIFICPDCDTPVTELQAKRRKERGETSLDCSVCGQRISLAGTGIEIHGREVVEMNREAERQRRVQTAVATVKGKEATRDFDVFLCHNSKDKDQVRVLAADLKRAGILPWFDEWELQPGRDWMSELEKQIARIRSAAVVVGRAGLGPWQNLEYSAFLREFVSRKLPVIPVVLGDAPKRPRLPVFLRGLSWVDFRTDPEGAFKALLWGITGEREQDFGGD